MGAAEGWGKNSSLWEAIFLYSPRGFYLAYCRCELMVGKQCLDCGCCPGRDYFAEFQEKAFMPDCVIQLTFLRN